MNPSYLAHVSKIVVAAASVVMFSPIASTFAATGVSTKSEFTLSNSTGQQLLADKKDDDDDKKGRSRGYKGKSTGFSLGIWQPAGTFTDVIARVSLKGKHGKKYHKERFLGDYKYKIKQKIKFVKGFKAGDRVVVRLYDTQNRFIGYSEFECLAANSTVNLILSANPTEYRVVRTVYGVDADEDGMVDTGTTTYDYFSQVSNQSVSFLSSSQTVKVSQFQAEGYSTVAKTSVYPVSYTKGEYTLVRQSINAFSSNLAEALRATPGSLVQLTEVSDNSSYELSQLLSSYRQVGVSKGVQVAFSDVSQDYWAKDFIGELAAMEVIEGFPDGTFRPDAPVTRAQFSALLRKAYSKNKVRQAIAFRDVSSQNWAYNAIRETYEMGFLNTVASREFNPSQSLTRLEVLVALARGLNFQSSSSTTNILSVYSDATSISSEYRSLIAAMTERGVIVNYPDVKLLNAERVATRAEVCALLYKSLVSTGDATDISSQYAVAETQPQAEVEQRTGTERMETGGERERVKPQRRNCNQGIGNGAEGCDPGNSRPHGGSNDEGGRTPGGKK
ncbi:S-layer homology domain-containing protein [Cylindrospermum sp. FACHB-282]|uniref:S-layer homology domain-containing protein n=1 Tax=Cylindrospermum sp. FACHB-282 TaxID=2692794 RepID=UPI00168874A1|nr:S-layer homology domain-containing protein [Cylindrospermum sp. FACHB-282]MBD2388530.1 S-layer homology domain-containing protein [Cylindrospermum sp. FACHB-282]